MAGFNDKQSGPSTSEQSPGGLFQKEGVDVQANATAEAYANDAKKYAEEAEAAARRADTDVKLTTADSEGAAASAAAAAQSATNAANSANEADEQADRAKSWAVGPSGANVDGTDTDNAHYWALQAGTHDSEYRQYVKDAQGWAHGDTESPLGGWTDTDNSKYWSEQSADSATSAATSAAAAKADSESAATNAANAAASATDSANSATASANSATAAATSATQADSDAQDAAASATAAANSATKADSDATRADSDAKAAAASAVEAQGWAINTDTDGTEDYSANSAKWWAEQAESHANSVKDDTEGLGIFIDDSGTKQSFAVDTEIIADTDWVKEHVSGNGGNVTWENLRDGDEFMSQIFAVNSNTGLEIVMESGKAELREYVPTPNFAISLAGAQPNASWFMADTTDTVSVSASEGTLSSITSATVSGSNTDVTIDNDNNTVEYPVANANGLYTLVVNASGSNDDSVSQTASANHTWRIYADYWLATNQSGADANFDSDAGRSTGRFQTGDITAIGYTFLTVSNIEFSGTFSFRTALGGLVVPAPTVFNITINGVTKQYKRYYLGNFSHETVITVSGG